MRDGEYTTASHTCAAATHAGAWLAAWLALGSCTLVHAGLTHKRPRRLIVRAAHMGASEAAAVDTAQLWRPPGRQSRHRCRTMVASVPAAPGSCIAMTGDAAAWTVTAAAALGFSPTAASFASAATA
jgi:hypothetical protein